MSSCDGIEIEDEVDRIRPVRPAERIGPRPDQGVVDILVVVSIALEIVPAAFVIVAPLRAQLRPIQEVNVKNVRLDSPVPDVVEGELRSDDFLPFGNRPVDPPRVPLFVIEIPQIRRSRGERVCDRVTRSTESQNENQS